MSVAYGIDIQEENDPYIRTAITAIQPLVVAATPGTFLVDFFPFLKHVPEWLPGAGFRRKAREWRELTLAHADTPFNETKQSVVGLMTLRIRRE